MQLLFREDLFVSQTKLSYEANCLEIENAEKKTERSELLKNYGINKRSYLTNLHNNTSYRKILCTLCWRGQCNMSYKFFY